MSESPSNYPPNYQATSPYGNAPTMVRLAGIFNVIMGGINIVAALVYVGAAIFMHLFLTGRLSGVLGMPAPAMSPAGSTMPRMAGMPPEILMVGLYVVYALLNLVAGTLELTAGIGILKRKPWVFGKSIAALSAGFLVSFTCSLMCVLPIGNAVYTLVVICMENCRRYMRNQLPA